MKYDKLKVIQSETISNNFVEKDVKKRRKYSGKLDILDVIIIPVAVGIVVALGFLMFNII